MPSPGLKGPGGSGIKAVQAECFGFGRETFAFRRRSNP